MVCFYFYMFYMWMFVGLDVGLLGDYVVGVVVDGCGGYIGCGL